MESRDLHLSAVRQVVLDEVSAAENMIRTLVPVITMPQVDTLFDSSFKSDTQARCT